MDYKLVVDGGTGVGKSALTLRLVSGSFVADTDPTITDSYRTAVVVDGEACHLDILDTAGVEEFSSERYPYLRDCDGVLIVYSITSNPSFQEVPNLYDQILRVKDRDRVPIVLVGNRCDLEQERQVATDEGQARGAQWGVPFMEASAKTGTNVEGAFFELVREIRRLA